VSAAEQAIQNMVDAQAMPLIAPSGTEQCPVGRVRIGVFFDGTNNNMYRDEGVDANNPGSAENALTNVVKLYRLYILSPPLQKAIYHHGVGSDSAAPKGVGARERHWDWQGGGFGAGGKARVTWGLEQLADFYSNNGNHLAKEKLFDTYGFSRGSAIARDFVNSVKTVRVDNLKKQNGYKYKQVGRAAIRIPAYEAHQNVIPTFLGVFDTVASFGLGGLQTGDALAGYNLFVDHTYVLRTVHMAAEDEIRGNFPLTSLFMDPKEEGSQDPQAYKDVMIEIWYPGAHSDVGGGYVFVPEVPAKPERWEAMPGPDGFPIMMKMPAEPAQPPKKPDLSKIPLRDMHAASLKAKVPLSALPDPQGPGDMEREYAAYDAYRSGQPYAIGKRYIQDFPSKEYRAMYYDQRDKQASIAYLKAHYIHDSRWGIDHALDRKQRTVHHMGPQPAKKG
jgi:hypothetical protein